MKTSGSAHLHTSINGWQVKLNGKKAFTQRLHAMAKDLSCLHAEMHAHLADLSGTKAGPLLCDGETFSALNVLKAELDQLRRVLWFHVEEATKKPVHAAGRESSEKRVEQVTDPARALSVQKGPASAAESASFFDRLNIVIDTYMQESRPACGKKPGAPKAFS